VTPWNRAPRALAAVAVAAALLVWSAGPALAHVDLDPEEAVAGSTTVLTFSFHHGRDGAPTTSLTVQMPAGTAVLDLPDKDGWTTTVEPSDPPVVVWDGGEVPDGVEETFDVEVRLPTEPGEVLFPAIQDGPAGELAWIAQEGGASEADNPAPRMVLTPDLQVTTTTEATTSTPVPATDEVGLDDGTQAVATSDDGGGVPWPLLVGAALLVALAVGAGVLLSRRRAGPEAG
jgi:periplasmic copper chaperone A